MFSMTRPSSVAIFLFAFIGMASGIKIDASESLGIKTEIDKTVLTTGDFLLYQIETTHPRLIQLQPISLNQYFKEGIDVEPLESMVALHPPSETKPWFSRWWPFAEKETPSQQTTRWSWRLWPSQEGEWRVPEIQIQSAQTAKEGTEPLYQGTTKAVTFTVHSLLDQQQKPVLKINNELPDAPVSLHWVWWVVGGGLVILLGIAYLFYKRKRALVPNLTEEFPHERALRRLRELEQFLLSNPQDVHQYYYLLSEIFREYLENQFSFSATRMTTQEFLPRLESATSYTAEERNQIVLLTQKSDLIKYAEALPTQTEMEGASREVVELVEKVADTLEETSEAESIKTEFQEAS